MRKILLAVFLAAVCAVPHAVAASASKATVTAIDEVGKTFRCHWQARDWTFQTTNATTFSIGPKPAAFGDLKVGHIVNVFFHRNGRQRTADRVVITAK